MQCYKSSLLSERIAHFVLSDPMQCYKSSLLSERIAHFVLSDLCNVSKYIAHFVRLDLCNVIEGVRHHYICAQRRPREGPFFSAPYRIENSNPRNRERRENPENREIFTFFVI